jgi:hypothetical protein
MSLAFSNTTLKNGLIQQLERKCGFNDGDISGNTLRMAQFTADINLAMDNVTALIFKLGGTWQYDDSNYDDYPILTTNLVASQRDYAFTEDENGNIIVGIYKVQVLVDGIYKDINPVDQQSQSKNVDTLTDGQAKEGTPYRYDKTGNGIFLDLIPPADVTDGLKIFVNRESSYFVVADTIKKPGFDGLVHEYLVNKVAYNYARDKRLANKNDLKLGLAESMEEVEDRYGRRERDTSRNLAPLKENNK